MTLLDSIDKKAARLKSEYLDTAKIEVESRWEKYREINDKLGSCRYNELAELLNLIDLRASDNILEAGSGSGFLTTHLLDCSRSNTVTATDVSKKGISDLRAKLEALDLSDNINAIYIDPENYYYPESYYNRFDKVASLATFHHFDNRNNGTGSTGRINLLQNIYRVLKPGGKLIMADVANNTLTQKYFDKIDNPTHLYPTGHPHNFFTTVELESHLKNLAYTDIEIYIKDVPWIFKNEEQAKLFIHEIHNAKCDVDESFSLAKKTLGIRETREFFYVNWQLFFATATKPLEE